MKTSKLVLMGILTALAAVLMIVEIPNPFVPFLKFEFSDIVIIIAFLVLGLKESIAIAVLKVVVVAMLKGPDPYSAIPYLGSVIAIVASITLVLIYKYIFTKENLPVALRYLSSIFIFTIILTIANYFIFTPAYFGWPTKSLVEVKAMFTGFLESNTESTFMATKGYLKAVVFAYVPFNVIKSSLIIFLSSIVAKNIKVKINNYIEN